MSIHFTPLAEQYLPEVIAMSKEEFYAKYPEPSVTQRVVAFLREHKCFTAGLGLLAAAGTSHFLFSVSAVNIVGYSLIAASSTLVAVGVDLLVCAVRHRMKMDETQGSITLKLWKFFESDGPYDESWMKAHFTYLRIKQINALCEVLDMVGWERMRNSSLVSLDGGPISLLDEEPTDDCYACKAAIAGPIDPKTVPNYTSRGWFNGQPFIRLPLQEKDDQEDKALLMLSPISDNDAPWTALLITGHKDNNGYGWEHLKRVPMEEVKQLFAASGVDHSIAFDKRRRYKLIPETPTYTADGGRIYRGFGGWAKPVWKGSSSFDFSHCPHP